MRVAICLFISLILSGCSSPTAEQPEPIFRITEDHDFKRLEFSQKGDRCLIASNLALLVVDRETGECLGEPRRLPYSLDVTFNSAAYTRDGQGIVLVSPEGVEILDADTLNTISTRGAFDVPPHYAYEVNVDGDMIFLDSKCKLMRIAAGDKTPTWSIKAGYDHVFDVHAIHDTFLAQTDLFGVNDTINFYDIAEGKSLNLEIEHEDTVRGIDFSSDGTLVASTSESGHVRINEFPTGKLVWETKADVRGAFGVALHSNNDLVAVGCMFGVKIWSIRQQECIASWSGHERYVDRLEISPDGKQLLSGSGDATAALWNLDDVVGSLCYRDGNYNH